MTPGLWRHAAWLGGAFLLGAAASRLLLLGAPAGTILAAACLLAGGVLVWRRARRSDESLAAIARYAAQWEEGLEQAELTAETIPEFDPLRTALQRTQQTLRSARGRRDQRIADLHQDTLLLQSILGTMVEAVVVVDGDSQLLYANPAAVRLLEVGEREAAGRLLHEVIRNPQLHELVDGVLRTGEERRAELELNRQGRLATVSGGPLRLEPARGAVLVLQDVTELRRLERVRREFVSNVSHELKTPLTAIQAYADALLDGALEDDAVNRGFVERILEQSERLRRLILDLLNLSRIESEDHALELETVDLNEVVRESFGAQRPVADSRQLVLATELSAEPVLVTADRDALRTVIDNLVRNALSYTPAGGTVTLRTRCDGGGVLEVQDTGVGVPREHQQRIFERFYRVDKARSREMGGTGLGLAIVKHFVELFGARVELESEQGRGSLFRIRWPA